MSVATEITRLQNAKSDLKRAIEVVTEQSIASSAKIDTYAALLLAGSEGMYIDPPVANGTYIKYKGGVYSDYNNLLSDRTPVGVACKFDACAFTLHPSEYGNNQWGYKSNVPTEATYPNNNYNGKYVYSIAKSYGASNHAIYLAQNVAFEDGTVGWIPSNGELELLMNNDSNINVAMNLIGGTAISKSNNYWACHSSSSNNARIWSNWYMRMDSTLKDIDCKWRVVTDF